MTTLKPIDIWKYFKIILPRVSEEAKQFKTHGKNSITIWFENKQPLIFTVNAKDYWKLEPYKM